MVGVAAAAALEDVATTQQATMTSSDPAKEPPNRSARYARRLVIKPLNVGTGTAMMNKTTSHKLKHIELTQTGMLLVELQIMSSASLRS